MIGIGRHGRQTMTLTARVTYTDARMESTNITENYERQAEELERAVWTIPSEQIGRRPDETRWSVLEIVCHLADAELLASARIRRIITQDRPTLWSYQQEQWAAALSYRQQRIEIAVARFALLRRENAALLGSLTEEIWQQTGFHDKDGTLSLRQLIEENYLPHTAKHLEQIEKVAAELATRNKG